MEINFSIRTKQILSVIFVIAGICLLGNTNNNPITFIERVFRPLNIGSGTLYYANLLPILLIYFSLKRMNEFREYSLLKTGSRRIIATIIILILGSQLMTYGIKTGKSMSEGLNSIYYNRNNSNNFLFIKPGNDDNEIVNCTIELENCSEQPREFYIKIFIPWDYKDLSMQKELIVKESDSETPKKFILKAKEKKEINIEFLENAEDIGTGFSGSASKFEFLLMNDKEQVKFMKTW